MSKEELAQGFGVRKETAPNETEPDAPPTWPFTVRTYPPNAHVEIVGHDEDYAAGMLLQRGGYQVRVSAPRYETKKMTVQHESGPTNVSIELDKTRQSFTVDATPANAQVHIEGEASYQDGMLLAWGEYRVRVSAPGYKAITVPIVHGTAPTRRRIALTPLERKRSPSPFPNAAAEGHAAKQNAGYFTRGSHSDDVLRLQGTPTSISSYESLGKEVWHYGLVSSVEIDLRTNKVLKWNNGFGNLKAKLLPRGGAASSPRTHRENVRSHNERRVIDGNPVDARREFCLRNRERRLPSCRGVLSASSSPSGDIANVQQLPAEELAGALNPRADKLRGASGFDVEFG